MKADHCLILAAGFGSRMGKIGKLLPKVLWPIYEKNLLEIQIAYARSLGFQSIYINVHHHADEIVTYIKNKYNSDINILIEEELLDIGGAIHNLAQHVGYENHLLVINCDQFIPIKYPTYKNILGDNTALLLLYSVNSSDGYNSVISNEEDLMSAIIQNAELDSNEQIFTYTGTCLVNLSKLKIIKGKSKFFDSVADYKKGNIKTVEIENAEYWDFGTKSRYYESIKRIARECNSSSSEFISFLKEIGAIDLSQITEKSYKSEKKNCFKFKNLTLDDSLFIYGSLIDNLD
jgi:mannose-1-phosphate guanylyltransferase